MSRLLRAAVALAAAVPIAVYLWIALHRLGYAYELDWMEGGSVELTARVAAGHSLYVAPSLAYVGWTYTPLYYWLTAAVSQVIGVGFTGLRLVSLIASLAGMGLLARLVIRESGDRIAGLLAAGLFAATYRLSGAWLDTGRVDSLFLALTLAALLVARDARTVKGGLAVGLLAFLAFFTKQVALVALLPALLVLAVRRPRAGVAALVGLGALAAGSTLVLNAASDGWYRYYVVGELAGQAFAPGVWVSFWRTDLLSPLWPTLVLGVAALIAAARSRQLRWGSAVELAAGLAGLLAAAYISRLHTGGYANVLMPAYAAVAVLGGVAYARLIDGLHARPGLVVAVLALGLLIAQGVRLRYPVAAQIPTAADRATGVQLLARLRALPGPVVVLRHPWYATLAGKGRFAQAEAVDDVLRSSDPRGARILRRSLATALNRERVRTVVLDGSFDAALLGRELARDFRRLPGTVTARPLYPLTDVRTAPTLVYVRVRAVAQAKAALGR